LVSLEKVTLAAIVRWNRTKVLSSRRYSKS